MISLIKVHGNSKLAILLLLLVKLDALLYLCGGSPKKPSCEVSLILAHYFKRCFD